MPTYPPSRIRNVALVGHNGSGKTTLAEALLFATGAVTRQGKVDDGSTVCDFEPEEIKRHMSLSLAIAPCILGDTKLNILDTPGYADFFGEVRAAASVVDLAVVVVSAVEGIEAQTEAAWELAARASTVVTPAAICVKTPSSIAALSAPAGSPSASWRSAARLPRW